MLIFIGIIAIAAYLLVPNYYYLRADALVKGDLVPVAPLYRVRIDKLFARCDSHVRAGQAVALASNFIDQASYERQDLQAQEQVELSKIGLDERVATAETTAASLQAAYHAAQLSAQRLGDQYHEYQSAYGEGAVPLVDVQQHKTQWETATQTAEADRLAWQSALKSVGRLNHDEAQRVQSSQGIAAQSQALASRVSSETLTAPVNGFIVDCIERPDNVIQPGSPLFEIFQPERAYVLAYYTPNAVQNIEIGEQATIDVAGIKHRVTGHVVSIYPELIALPSQLTRFFWQHVQWAQYRPVRIQIDNLSFDERQKLYFDAQGRVTIKTDHTPPKFLSDLGMR